MSTTDLATTLRMERTFAGTPEEVFDAWTDPEVLRRWWGAAPDWSTPEALVDLRAGGTYRLTMERPDGTRHIVTGEYREIDRPHRLAYTWAWVEDQETGELGHESFVEVDFAPDGDGTTITLVHTALASEQSRDDHGHGWGACLDNLEARLFAG